MSKIKKEKNEKEITGDDIKDTELKESEKKPTGRTEQALADLEVKYEKLQDQYLRKIAEFENYKRRTDVERSEFFAYANQKLIADLLPVLDDFDRITKAYDEKHDIDSLKKGVELVYQKFNGIMVKYGLKEIESDGREFDVNLHEALMQQPDLKSEPNTVIATHEKGYYLKDKVLRHAKVIVSAKPDDK